MRWRKIIKIISMIIFTQIALAQSNQHGVKTENYQYNFNVPNGWVSDTAVKGLNSVFYPKTSTWYKSPTVMYINVISLDDKDMANIFRVIDQDIENYYINTPGMKVTYGQKLHFDKGQYLSMVVYLYGASDGATSGHSLALAYIPQATEMMNIVMSADSREEFEKNLPVFESLVRSYDVVQSKYAASRK